MAKILIVDDDILITGLMQTLVNMDGHEAIIVNDRLSGYDLCELLRANPQFNQTPIIIISAKEDTQSKEKALKLGATEYINKPFDIDHFLKTIQRLTS